MGPLFVAERLLAARVAETKQEARAARSAAGQALETARQVRDSVSDLNRQVRERLAQVQGEEEQQAQQAAHGSFDDLVALYNRAADPRWVDPLGLRVPAGVDSWLRLRAGERNEDGGTTPPIELTYEGPNLEPYASVRWAPDEQADAVFVRLAEELKPTGHWQGDAAFDPEELLVAVVAALRTVITSHTGPHGDKHLRQVIEIVDGEWAVTSGGLDSLDKQELFAERSELLQGSNNPAFHRLQARVQSEGRDEATFLTAIGNAERIHRALWEKERDKIAKVQL